MRVCKHGCGFKMFCSSRAYHASTNLKKVFLAENSTNLLYFPIPPSAKTWKMFINMLCQFFFFRLSWHFKRENPYFWKHLFCKTRTDYAYKLRVQDLSTGESLSFNQFHYKEFCVFSRESYFIKSVENFLPVFA